MFSDPFSITYNAVQKDLVRVNQDANGSDYFLDDGDHKFRLLVRHGIPSNPADDGEQHHLRLYVEHYDVEGTYLRTSSPWVTVKSIDSPQVSAEMQFATEALVGALSAGNISKLLAREV